MKRVTQVQDKNFVFTDASHVSRRELETTGSRLRLTKKVNGLE